MKKKQCDVFLAYFKQGDDYDSCVEKEEDSLAATISFRDQMVSVVNHLDRIAKAIEKFGAKDTLLIDAGTHCISFYGPEDFINYLIENELATEAEIFDDEEEYDEEDELLLGFDGDEIPHN